MGRRTFREIVESLARSSQELRGSLKLRAALERFQVTVEGRVALDVGAAAGGFTRVLLDAGAKKVYAVDAGHGQLLGSLRQDPRVVNLEATNIAELTDELVPDPIELFTVDVSYLPLRRAVTQLQRVAFAERAELIGLVKPMFELQLASAPSDRPTLDHALAKAVDGVMASGWTAVATMDSPVTGAKGAPEMFIHATWESE